MVRVVRPLGQIAVPVDGGGVDASPHSVRVGALLVKVGGEPLTDRGDATPRKAGTPLLTEAEQDVHARKVAEGGRDAGEEDGTRDVIRPPVGEGTSSGPTGALKRVAAGEVGDLVKEDGVRVGKQGSDGAGAEEGPSRRARSGGEGVPPGEAGGKLPKGGCLCGGVRGRPLVVVSSRLPPRRLRQEGRGRGSGQEAARIEKGIHRRGSASSFFFLF